ncbi:extracellular solute-binding protein [Lihuaxuella thermophila]|uniref:Maltodextrin-binding protein n=1 Tax=Lihuaxuella thermophila TaxID=1173111 RepID=A0A1H8DFS7_9BACL|nr:extracellular solute-binding protein [Lihuaxuella thermophila]SEN06153.1 arabinogalactan oligomer / maltooligosaccharide transport system substrate-binding protein [Lihuaxuella thermophila]
MSKKFLSLSMGLVLALSLLTACGPKRDADQVSNPGEKPEKLVVWENADDGKQIGHTKKLAAEFEKKTGIKVEVLPVSLLKQQEKLTLDGPAGKGADLVTWPHDQLGEAVIKGLIQPIQADASVTGQFEESSLKALTYDGKLMGLPKVTESIALIYNKKLMPNPPETFEELYQFAKDFTQPAEKKYGVLFEGENLYYTYFLIAANGGYIFKEQNGKLNSDEIGLNNAGTVKALTEIQKWYQEGLIPKGVKADVINGLFKEGKVAAVINGPWAIRDYQSANIDLGVAPIPKAGGKEAQTLIGVKGWYLSAYSKSPKYATELMKFLTSKEALKSRFGQTGEIPPHKEILTDPVIAGNPLVNGFAQQAKTGVPMPSIPEMGQVWEPINNAHTFIATGKQTPEQALNGAVKIIREKIKVQKQ